MRKLLALTLSLLMVFSVMPMVMASAETYFTPEDVSNPDNWVVGQWDMNTGAYSSSNVNRATLKNKIAVQPGTIYGLALSGSSASGLNIVLRTYNSKAAFVASYSMVGLKEYTAPAGIYYITITVYDKANLIDLVKAGSVVATMTVKGTKEYTASFEGTETAVLAESVDAIEVGVETDYKIALPEATLAEGEFAGWATKDAPTTVIAAGTEVVVNADTTFYAVLTDKPAAATPAAPTVASASGTSVTLTKVTNAVYSMDGTTWKSSNTFTGLEQGIEYTFYQKLNETLAYDESAVSEALVYALPVSYLFDWVRDKSGVNDFNETITPASGTLTTKNYTDGTCMTTSRSLAVGDVLSYTTKTNVTWGIYRVDFELRASGGRAQLGIKLGDRDYGTFVTGSGGSNTVVTLFNDYVQEEQGPITITFTAKTAGTIYIEQLHLTKVGDFNPTEAKIKIDGEVVAVIEPNSTYVIPTPAKGYCYSDGTTDYYGGEEVAVKYGLNLTTTVLTTKVVYTMDEGSRIVSGYTEACNPGNGVFEEINGDWVFKLPSKADQPTHFTLPEDWFEKPRYKATSISFSISKTSGAAGNTEYVEFTDGKNIVKISSGYTGMLSKYTVDVDESLYGYRTFQMKLKGGSNFTTTKDYIYIDDVTVNFEYDFDYVASTTYDVTIDGEVVATVEEGETFTLPAAPEGKQYVDGYVAGQEFVVTEALAFFTEDIPFVAPVVAITMVEGAQLRFNEFIGMRYRATVDAAAVAAYEAEGYDVEMGTLISPADIIGSFDALTFEADANNYINVVTTGYYATSENEIAGSIVNIKETNVGRNYIARSYVKLTAKDGSVYVSYATENDNTRSVKFLAKAVIDNDALPVNTAQVALIEKWAVAADWKK